MVTDFEVIVIVYKSRFVLGSFLENIGTKVPIILVDNSYHDEDLSDIVTDFPNVRRVDSGGNLGYSAAANVGAEISVAPYLVFMNPDTQPTAPALESLVDYLRRNPDVAVCGAAGNGTAGGGAQPTASRILAHTLGIHRKAPRRGLYYQDVGGEHVDVEWVAGSCLAIRSDVFQTAGGFDPTYFIYMSDFDLGRRLRAAGHRQVILGDVVVPHDDGGSSDLPAVWTWERRGRAWTRYLRRTRNTPVALGLTVLLAVGYGARTLVYMLRGNRVRAVELRTYLWALGQEWVRPSDEEHRG